MAETTPPSAASDDHAHVLVFAQGSSDTDISDVGNMDVLLSGPPITLASAGNEHQELGDLDWQNPEMIPQMEQHIAQMPPGHPDIPRYQQLLGGNLMQRFYNCMVFSMADSGGCQWVHLQDCLCMQAPPQMNLLIHTQQL
ncbi:hypothetical protein MVEN_00808200 [Mycena venus]|uniref:Uncharacterized protein n=1 Tax=Mycena venus TaxID=2733690 RepID=A0A8H7D651_9AGAR|nr:hypothetical protein MVEN_00808200 [Mycena venus]